MKSTLLILGVLLAAIDDSLLHHRHHRVAAQSGLCVHREAGDYCAPGFPTAIYSCPDHKMARCANSRCVTGCDGRGRCTLVSSILANQRMCHQKKAGQYCHPELKGVYVQCPSNDAFECASGLCITTAYGFGTCHSASANTYDNTNTNANLLTGPRPSPHAPALVVSTATPTMAANAPRPTANSPRLTMPSPVSVPIPNTPPKLPSLLDDLPSVPLLAVNVPDKTNSKEDLDDLAVPFLGEDMGDELAALPEGVRLSPRASYIE